MITKEELARAVEALGLKGKPVCVHSSMRSFGDRLEGGLGSLSAAFLEESCTVVVPTFTDMCLVKPVEPYMPERNGAGDYSYFLNREESSEAVFDTGCKLISTEDMGIFSEYVLNRPESVRGDSPLNSFTALGKDAERLMRGQSAYDAYAPLRQVYADDGFVLLIGVGLTNATAIHFAEQTAGRELFVRWAKRKDGTVRPVSVGSCSEGFENLHPALEKTERRVQVGKSVWRCWRMRDLIDICAAEIRKDPRITHCGEPDCDRCNDAVAGGPIIDDALRAALKED